MARLSKKSYVKLTFLFPVPFAVFVVCFYNIYDKHITDFWDRLGLGLLGAALLFIWIILLYHDGMIDYFNYLKDKDESERAVRRRRMRDQIHNMQSWDD